MTNRHCLKSWLVAIVLLASTLGQAAPTQPGTPEVQHESVAITTGEFCETDASFSTADCAWQVVKLPHQWSPTRSDEGWGVYRFSIANPGPGSYALVARRLSLNGKVVVSDRSIASSVPGIGRPVYLRYWPQIYPFHLDSGITSGVLPIQILVQGHASMKNGLGQLNFAQDGVAQKMFVSDMLIEVTAVLTMAAAIGMAGLLGFFASGRLRPSEKLLLMVSFLSVLAAIRTAIIFVSDPPVSLKYWSALSLCLFVWISLWILAILATYLKPESKSIGPLAAISGLVIAFMALHLPSRLLIPLVDSVLLMLSLAGVILLAFVFLQAMRKKDSNGWLLLGAFLIILALLTHDLRVHFGIESIAGNYLLLRTLPILVIILTAFLLRTLNSQRDLEHALQVATDRREDLLRDLHDGIGSRLVALSFSVRAQGANTLITGEVNGLIHELQVIQKAVRSGNTDLQSLLSDLRHLYSQVGSGSLPLHWQVEPEMPAYDLTADQAIAIVRILEEAIANAMKHARPSKVWVTLSSCTDYFAATLSVSDDGIGHFQPANSGGLRNIELRGRRAGLDVQFDLEHGVKRVVLRFPRIRRRQTWRDRLSIRHWPRWFTPTAS